MDINMQRQNSHLTVHMSGQFTFNDNQSFKDVIAAATSDSVQNVTVDFAGVDFIDSAGLGMLLLLRDNCSHKNINVSLTNPKGQVEKIFSLSKFDQLFSIAG